MHIELKITIFMLNGAYGNTLSEQCGGFNSTGNLNTAYFTINVLIATLSHA